MGFLNPDDDGTTTPQPEQKTYGSFLSDNPPPEPQPEQKVPQWSEIPKKMLASAPGSAWQYAKDFAHPFIHPQETVEGLGKLALGLIQKGYANETPEHDYRGSADAVGQMILDRYGSADNFKKTLAEDPVGTAGDISTILSPGGLLARGPGMLGKIGKVVSAASKATDPLNIPRAGLWGAQKLGAVGAGVTTGAGMRAFEEAGKSGYDEVLKGDTAGQKFRAAQNGDTSPRDTVNSARQALDEIIKERGALYNNQKGGLNNNQILSFGRINQAMVDAHKINKFHAEELGESTRALRDELDNKIMHWATLDPKIYHTPLGFDALKKAINDIGDKPSLSSAQKAIVSKYADAIKRTLTSADPKYASMLKNYREFSENINELEKAFSLPADVRKQSVDTAFRKLQSALRRNVNTNFGWRETLLDMIEKKVPGMKAEIAGHALSSPEPHGITRLVPGLSAANADSLGHVLKHLVVTSPVLMGRAAHRIGQAAGATSLMFPRGTSESMRQLGRMEQTENNEEPYKIRAPVYKEARGGAVDRALRLARKH